MDNETLLERFIEYCVAPERALVSPQKISQARMIAEWSNEELYEVLMDLQLLNLEMVNEVLAAVTGFPAADPMTESFKTLYSKQTLSLVHHRTAIEHRLFPLWIREGKLHVAMANPTDEAAVRAVEKMSGHPLERHVCVAKNILRAVVRYYNLSSAKSFETLVRDALDEVRGKRRIEEPPSIWTEPLSQALMREVHIFPSSRRETAKETEVGMKLVVQKIIDNAIYLGASDIHFEPFENIIKVRFRRDGILFAQWFIPSELRVNLLNRIKVMAGIDVTLVKRAQEGYIAYENVLPVGVDIRVSVVPSMFGERIALRLLDKHRGLFNPALLGMSEADLALFEQKVRAPYGLILMTGPTGSGKTTTIYAALNHLNNENRCIITIEDPVEYELRGINQLQVEPRFELGFAEAFKAILRQDPDVILLGEIRDPESAQTAVTASGAGHLVLSTLHTNDAAHAVPRLAAMNCDLQVLSNSLQLVAAQRLLRRLCPACKAPEAFAGERLAAMRAEPPGDGDAIFAPQGCPACNHLGYVGRTGAFELLAPNDAIRELIMAKGSGLQIFREARAAGMKSLREDALRLARAGVTSLDEVERVTSA